MLILTDSQFEALAQGPRERFLDRLATHLEATSARLRPTRPLSFAASPARARLRELLRLALASGFRHDRDAATLIEYFVLFGVDPDAPAVRAVLTSEALPIAEKLESLWALRRREVWT